MLSVAEENTIRNYCTGKERSVKARDNAFDLLKKIQPGSRERRELDSKKHILKTSKFCEPYRTAITYADACPPVGERVIFVVDFLDYDSEPFISDKKYCKFETRSSLEFEYNIVYIPIPYDDINLDIINAYTSQFFNTCNTMVIYFRQLRSILEKFKTVFNFSGHLVKLQKFLDFMKLFPIPRTLFLETRDTLGEFDGFVLPSDGFTRVLNIKPIGFVPNQLTHKEHREEQYGVEYYLVKKNYIGTPRRLSCATWFKRFITTAFECGKGRLFQRSGTCYMTSVFNMIFLGENIKHIFISAVNAYVKHHPELKPEIIKPLADVAFCPLLSDDRSKVLYIARFIYDIVCRKTHVKSYEDLFFEGSKEYFSENMNPAVPEVYGKGGVPTTVIYQLMMWLGIDFKVSDGTQFYNPVVIDNKVLRSTRVTELWLSKLPRLDNTIEALNTDCILVSPARHGAPLKTVHSVYNNMTIESAGFVPEVCNIIFTLEKVDKPTEGHSIMGFKCNGIYKAYDSGINQIFDCNWYNDVNALYLLMEELFEVWNTEGKFKRFHNPRIEHIIYTNGNRRFKYLETGSHCNF